MALCEAAGVAAGNSERDGRGRRVMWDKEKLLAALRKKAEEVKRTPRLKDFETGSPSPFVFYRVFGSWNKALEEAGFEPNRVSVRKTKKGITKDYCAKSLRRLSEILGGIRPTLVDVASETGIAAGCPTGKTIHSLFGSFKEALKYAGLYDLPTGRRKKMQEKQNIRWDFFDRIISGREFLLQAEIPLKPGTNLYLQFRKYAGQKNVTVINLHPTREVVVLLNWLRGIKAAGILPEKNEIVSKMGERSFQYLLGLLKGESMQEIADREGITKERVRQIVSRGIKRAVGALTGKNKTRKKRGRKRRRSVVEGPAVQNGMVAISENNGRGCVLCL